MEHKTRDKALSWLLSLALMLSLLPGLTLTARATTAYDNYLVKQSDASNSLYGKVVYFNRFNDDIGSSAMGWYIIADDSTALNEGTVTLLAQNAFCRMSFDPSSSDYADSAVETYLAGLTETNGSFANVAEAIVGVDLQDVNVTGAKLWLLSETEANGLNKNLFSCGVRSSNAIGELQNWWLRTKSNSDNTKVTSVKTYNINAPIDSAAWVTAQTYGVRPALKLDLSKVTFDAGTKTFALPTPHTHNETTFTAWTSADSLPDAAGSYYLTQDVTIGSKWSVPEGTTNLCLNGKSITYNGNDNPAIEILSGRTLNLYDEGEGAHRYTLEARNEYSTFGQVNDEATGDAVKTFNGGYIAASVGRTIVRLSSNSVFSMNGGTLIGGAKGVFNSGGTFTMNGGNILGNSGGGVSLDSYTSRFTMTGGTISYNTWSTASAQGGGVAVGYGIFTMSGGTISYNSAGNYLYPGFGGVFVGRGGTFELSGSPIIANNTTFNGSDVASNVCLWDSASIVTTIRITGALTYTNPIGVMKVQTQQVKEGNSTRSVERPTPGVFTEGWTTYMSDKTPTNYFTSESTYPVEKQGDELVLAAPQPIPYQAASWDSASNQVHYTAESCADYTVVTSSTTSFEDGKWYVVKDTVESVNSYVITVTGTANLILCDGATLKTDGVTVSSGNTLNIYGQSAGTGKLIASSGSDAGIGGTLKLDGNWDAIPSAGICGTINIHGGTVEAQSNDGAAIGGYGGFAGGEVTIYGGTVTAWSNAGGAGIGGGGDNTGAPGGTGGSGGTVTIYGGTVNATGGTGIGGGATNYGTGGAGGTVTIYGGTVNATGHSGYGGTGIGGGGQLYGGGEGGSGGTVAIYGGTVKTSGDSVGIGGGKDNGSHGSLTLGTGMHLYGGTSANPETDLSNHVAQSNGDYARSQYMTVNNVAPHTHSFTYTASGATITATCSADGCSLTNKKATLTIVAPLHTNVGDGKSAEATITDASSIKGSATVSYYAATKSGTTYTKTGSALGSVPTGAGNYVAEITVGGVTASVGYTIGKAASSVTTAPTAVTGLFYNNTAKTLVTAGTASGGTMQYALGANNTTAPTSGWGTDIPSGTNAETYYVWYKVVGDADHADSAAAYVEVKIGKAAGGAATPVAVPTDVISSAPRNVALKGTAGQEYVIVTKDGTPDWTDAAVPNSENTVAFLSLAPATEYEIYTRVKETANTLAGAPQRTAYVTSLESVGLFFDSDLVGGLGTADPDPANDGYTYRWYRADVTNDVKSNVAEISGATGKTYTVSADDVGKHVFYKVYKGSVEIGESSPLGPFASAATVTFNSMGGSAVEAQTGLAYDAKLTKPADPERSGYHFAGWYTDTDYSTKWSFDVDTVKWADTTLYAKWTAAPVYEITGVVKNSSNAAVSGAAVTLAQGYKTLGQTTTNTEGQFAFTGVESGTYNIIAEKDSQTKTELVQLTENQNLTITMPEAGKNSVLDNDNAGNYAATVGGLDEIAAAETVSGGSTVTIMLTVTAEVNVSEGEKAQFNTEKAAIQTVAAGKTLECLDLTLQKVVTGTGAGTTDIGGSNTQLLTIIIPYATNGKSNIAVYRYHDGQAVAMKQNPSAGEEGFVVGTDSITIYAKGFSTYAIGYTTPTYSGGGSSGGSSGSTITVPVSGDSASVSVSASVSGTTATVKAPTTAQLDKVIGESVKTGDVTIDVSGLKKDIATVSIPTETVKAIEKAVSDPDNDAIALTVKLTDGSVTFDAKALAAVAQQAKGSTIQLNLDNIGESKLKSAQKTAIRDLDVQAVYDAYLTSNGQRISDFKGGKATVTVSYALKDGQTGRGVVVWYVAEDGKTTEVPTTYTSKEVTFTIEHFSNYVIVYDAARAAACPQDNTCPISAFTDADPTAWYHDGVHYALENGIMSGYGNGKFGPGDTTSRAMMAQILYNMEGKPAIRSGMPFADVTESDWYAAAVSWAESKGYVTGYANPSGTGMIFAPNDPVTREQLVTILYRYAQDKGVDVSVGENTNILSYDDAFSVSDWAMSAMQWACGSGVVTGKTASTLNPKDAATRAEIATIQMRYSESGK